MFVYILSNQDFFQLDHESQPSSLDLSNNNKDCPFGYIPAAVYNLILEETGVCVYIMIIINTRTVEIFFPG